MRILSIMCDMFRPDVLKRDNEYSRKFLEYLNSIGGHMYTNCFTNGPDTGRSMGCYWSGKIPKENGCDRRAHYPKFYLNQRSFLDELSECGYEFHFFTNPNEKVLGILPERYEKLGHHNKDLNLDKFLKGISLANNMYVHFALTDMHWALDDFGANSEGVNYGLRVLCDSIGKIMNTLDYRLFDFVLIFSDHGFKYDYEFASQEKYLFLNKDRSNVLMFAHRKNDTEFSYEDKLCSLIDVYPTIMELMGKECKLKGISLYSKSEHDCIVAEDHLDFKPVVNQTIMIWAIIYKRGIIFRTTDKVIRENSSLDDISDQDVEDILKANATDYGLVMKESAILKLYDVMANDRKFYTNGEPRMYDQNRKISKRIHRKIRRYLHL